MPLTQNMTDLPLLHTPRCQITLLQSSDAPLLRDFCLRNQEHLAPWEGVREANYFSLDACNERIARMQGQFEQGISMPLVIFNPEHTQMLGTCFLSVIVRGFFQACYLGYSVDAAQQGKGLMFEALQEVIRYAFEEMRLHRIMANYVPHNLRSAHLLTRLGFSQEGYAKGYLKIAGQWQDHILTALTNPQEV
jgi:ribosomal-protein-alanine N-acetyltransferase